MTDLDYLQSALTYAYDAVLLAGTAFLGIGFIVHVSDRQTVMSVKQRERQIAQAAAISETISETISEATPFEMPIQIKEEEKVLRDQMPSPWEP